MTRRAYLRRVAAITTSIATAISITDDHSRRASAGQAAPNKTIVNSILSAYGLPTLPDVRGFTPLTQQYARLVVQFQYPSAWVVQRNVAPKTDSAGLLVGSSGVVGPGDSPLEGRASGLTAADYRRAEGVAFFVSALDKKESISEVSSVFIAELVTPGDATGSAPEVRVTKDVMDDDGYRVIDTLYESTTISGYTVERKARTRATVLKNGKIYALNASCTATRWKKISPALETSLRSFQVFIL